MLEIRRSILKAAAMLAFCIAFIAWMLPDISQHPRPIVPLIIAGIVTLCGLAAFSTAFDRRVQIAIDDKGIHSRYVPGGFIAFSAIRNAEIVWMGRRHRYLCITLHDPLPTQLDNDSLPTRFTKRLGKWDINIPLSGLDHSEKQIATACASHAPKAGWSVFL